MTEKRQEVAKPKMEELRKKLLTKRPKRMDYDELLVRKHHILMKTYGWIPLEEFVNLPMTTVNNLLELINEEWEAEKEQSERLNNKSKRLRR